MAEKQKRYAIIVAGGSGSRMNTSIPKQFLLLKGKPVLQYSLEKFHEAGADIILVLPEFHLQQWKELKLQHSISIPHQVTSGGSTRSGSVYNGLKCVENENSITGVHDAVRAMISLDLITRLFDIAEEKGNAIPVIPLSDSIRKIEGQSSIVANREDYRIVQTPQVFHTAELIKAFHAAAHKNFTDEASLMEACGHRINLVNGEQANFKITYPQDILIAESLLK